MSNEKIKYWQCNECKILYPVGARPNICVCGNDMLVNATKNTMIIFHDASYTTNEKEKKR